MEGSVGTRLQLKAKNPTTITSALGSMCFVVEIVKPLSVGPLNRVLLVRVVDRPTIKPTSPIPTSLVAKTYNSQSPSIQPLEGLNCDFESDTNRQHREVKAYARLLDLQGTMIPTFYGEYEGYTQSFESKMFSISLFEYIEQRTLDALSVPDLGQDGIQRAKHETRRTLEECHARGVFHHDIQASNILFTGTNAVVFDWEGATFIDDKSLEDPRNWARSDLSALESTFKQFGVKDERPDLPKEFCSHW